MARRAKVAENGVSLFPFMSILACLIGILTLMISVTMQVQQMEKSGRTEEEMDRALENRDLLAQAEKIKEGLEKKNEQLKEEKATVAVMAKLEDQKIALTMEIDGLKKANEDSLADTALQKRVENMKKEVVAIKKERPPFSKRLQELQDEIKARKEAPKPKESVVIQPRGVGEGGADEIFFVECNSTGIVLLDHEGGKKSISTAAIKTSGVYATYLDKVKKTNDSMVLFLIRKSGDVSFRWAAASAEIKYKLPTGKLPIPNDGDIDLSLFKR
ncbi:hypothetical protein N9986_01035 [Akkermansiaceae bacterium]|nr:hypothetical protein [Akkermansiaceae bacterium]